jgi:hypothetical protein
MFQEGVKRGVEQHAVAHWGCLSCRGGLKRHSLGEIGFFLVKLSEGDHSALPHIICSGTSEYPSDLVRAHTTVDARHDAARRTIALHQC